MKGAPLLIAGIFLSLVLSWGVMILGPYAQLGQAQPGPSEGVVELYPTARPGLAQQGEQVYRVNGCYYCHTQQTRPRDFGSDFARDWGLRHSVARDYLYADPVMLGRLRIGPDLANIGERQTNAWWHLAHLYDPRIAVPNSPMPSFSFLFEKRPVGRGPSADALRLPPGTVEDGYEIVPKREAQALVAYLLNLRSNVPVFEAPIVPDPEHEPFLFE